MLIAINGELKRGSTTLVDVTDSSFLYGDSLFETIRADGQSLIWVEEHLDRIETSCNLCGIPFDRKLAKSSLEQVRQQIEWPAARVRLTVSRGSIAAPSDNSTQTGFQLVTAQAYAPPTAGQYRLGVECCFAPNRRINAVTSLPQMKRGNYADCLYASRYARQKNTFEAIFQEENGELLEGAISNLFIFLDGVLVTPLAGNRVLPGITRQQVIALAAKQKVPVLEHPIHYTQFPHVTEAFLTSSLFGLLPVRRIGKTDLRIGPLGQLLRKELGSPFYYPE